MADIIYVKTRDGVIVRFTEYAVLSDWVRSGRLGGPDQPGDVTGEDLWLDSDETWKPLSVLLVRLGLVHQSVGDEDPDFVHISRIDALPDLDDESEDSGSSAMPEPAGETEQATAAETESVVESEPVGLERESQAEPEPLREPEPEPTPESDFEPTPQAESEPTAEVELTAESRTESESEPTPEPEPESVVLSLDESGTGPQDIDPDVSTSEVPAEADSDEFVEQLKDDGDRDEPCDSGRQSKPDITGEFGAVREDSVAEPAFSDEQAAVETVRISPVELVGSEHSADEPEFRPDRPDDSDQSGETSDDAVQRHSRREFKALKNDLAVRNYPEQVVEHVSDPIAETAAEDRRKRTGTTGTHAFDLEEDQEFQDFNKGSPTRKLVVIAIVACLSVAAAVVFLPKVFNSQSERDSMALVDAAESPEPASGAAVRGAEVHEDTAPGPADASPVTDASAVSDTGSARASDGQPDAATVPPAPDASAAEPETRTPELVKRWVEGKSGTGQAVNADDAVKPAAVDSPAVPAGREQAGRAQDREPSKKTAVVEQAGKSAAVDQVEPVPVRDRSAAGSDVQKPESTKGDYDSHMAAGSRLLATDPDKALVHFQAAHQARPRMVEPLARMGDCAFRLGRLESAAEYFQRSLKVNDRYSPAIVGLARVHKALGNSGDARYFYTRYLDINPEGSQSAEARQYLGR